MQEKINLSNGVRLSKNEMKNVMGGISAEEYCDILYAIINDNKLDEGAEEGARYGWDKAGCNRFHGEINL